jgi:hypothetical protein
MAVLAKTLFGEIVLVVRTISAMRAGTGSMACRARTGAEVAGAIFNSKAWQTRDSSSFPVIIITEWVARRKGVSRMVFVPAD